MTPIQLDVRSSAYDFLTRMTSLFEPPATPTGVLLRQKGPNSGPASVPTSDDVIYLVVLHVADLLQHADDVIRTGDVVDADDARPAARLHAAAVGFDVGPAEQLPQLAQCRFQGLEGEELKARMRKLEKIRR
ncbi:unnamed protein product [Caenorhabditis auriculariae]|uniref:Uncharacterized protein n=1 Tax=Caenorhabditis auriculariae TaxID=2777116 RepID=A0A8S1H8M6_9PELO|nr:unnamed protein product [Caenorhabditis auriculariae]